MCIWRRLVQDAKYFSRERRHHDSEVCGLLHRLDWNSIQPWSQNPQDATSVDFEGLGHSSRYPRLLHLLHGSGRPGCYHDHDHQRAAVGISIGLGFHVQRPSNHWQLFPLDHIQPRHCPLRRKAECHWWPQFLTIAFWKTVVCLIGIFGTNAIAYRYGTVYWNLWDMCDVILTNNCNGGARCAIFLFAILMSFSEQVKNLSANLISFGADSACLVPKYLNINRGMILGLTIGFVIQPWHILATARAYLTFLTGYSLFLGRSLHRGDGLYSAQRKCRCAVTLHSEERYVPPSMSTTAC